MANNNNNYNKKSENDLLQLQDLIVSCMSHWRWFILSILLCVGAAVFYVLRTEPKYTRTASLLIKESNDNGIQSQLSTFSDMGMFSTNTNVHNELRSIQSISVMAEVVNRMKLYMDYKTDNKFHKKSLYGVNLPINAEIVGPSENDGVTWDMDVDPNGSVIITRLKHKSKWVGEKSDEYKGTIGDSITTPIGKIIVTKTAAFSTLTEPTTFYIKRLGLVSCIESYLKRLKATFLDKEQTTIIDLEYTDVSIQRAEDFLNTVIAVYNENWVKAKNQIAVNTSQFIDDRLKIIEQELGNVDNDISSYKSEHNIPNVEAAANMYMTNANEANARVMDLNNQLYMARYVRSYMSNEANNHQLLPVNSGINSQFIEQQISEYNNKLLQRNTLVANSSERNPLVADIDNSLRNLRIAIITSIDNQINSLNNQIATFRTEERTSNARITSNPQQAKYLISVERQQKVKESLYLFLLQKREENELSQAFSAYNTQVINPPHGLLNPTAPKKLKIFLASILLGIIIPIGILYLKENLNTKIRGKKDLESCPIPFIGEIPSFTLKKRRVHRRTTIGNNTVVVGSGRRDIINEAFRVLRSNLEFMSENGGKSNIIAITSFNPGSGKSLISLNTAVSLAIRSKRVLLIDGDLRHSSTSAYINNPATGLSNYLNGSIADYHDIIVKDIDHDNLHFLPVGTIPPNPAELLLNDRLKQLLDAVREEYDYVMLDCPPIEIVADTRIISKYADRTIFVVRAGLFERSMLPELENIYKEGKYSNLGLILNGTANGNGRLGYSYGYRYGYHYGSYYGEEKKKK